MVSAFISKILLWFSFSSKLALRLRSVLLILALFLGQAFLTTASAKIPYKNYYRLSLQGEAMGWAFEEVNRLPDGSLEYFTQMNLKFSRMGEASEIKMRAEVYGDAQGRPLRYSYKMIFGDQIMEFLGERTDEGFRLTRKAGSSKESKLVSLDPNIRSAALAMVLFLEGDLKAGQDMDEQVLSEELGQITSLRAKLSMFSTPKEGEKGDRQKEYQDKKMFVLDMEIMGQKGTQIIAPDGTMLMAELPGMGIKMELVDKETAMADIEAADLLAWSLIRPSKIISSPRTLKKARYRLSLKPRPGTRPMNARDQNAGYELDIPESPCQRVQKKEDAVIVDVRSADLDQGCGASSPPQDKCSDLNLFEGAGHPAVRQMAKKVLGDALGDPKSLLILKRHVYQYIEEKNYRSLYATAPDIIESRAGDCTEHSVLLSALIKASGFPAQWVMGLVYVDGVFWYHEWVEAFYGGQWIVLDGTQPQDVVDATHIALSRSCTVDDFLASSAGIVSLIGRLEIEVLDLN